MNFKNQKTLFNCLVFIISLLLIDAVHTGQQAQAQSFSPIKINFQPANLEVPACYLADFGELYSSHNGYEYGWNISHTDVVRSRGVNPNPLLDTLCYFHANGVWEIALANRTYNVTVSVGDPGFTSTYTINVEGINYWSAVQLQANQFLQSSKLVTVRDGLLTIDAGNSKEKQTRLNYIEILATSLPSTPIASTTPSPMQTSVPTPIIINGPTLTPVANWVPCILSAAQVNLTPLPEQNLIEVDLTFPNAGYWLSEKGQIAIAAGLKPDGTTYLSNVTVGTKLEIYTGSTASVVTTERLTYPIHYGDTTYFAFRILYNGIDTKIKELTIVKPKTP